MTETIRNNYPHFVDPLESPDFFALVRYVALDLGQKDLAEMIANHFIKDDADIDKILELIPKLYCTTDKDYTILMVNPDLLKRTNYQARYNERYMD